MKKVGIYALKSFKNGKMYIGSSVDIGRRLRDHKRFLTLNRHVNIKMQNHFNKYGLPDMTFYTLEVCNKSDLIQKEQYWIDRCKPVFNICQTAGNTKGHSHTVSEVSKEKMSKAKKGIPRGYPVTVYKGGKNIQSKIVIRTSIAGEVKIYDSLSGVSEDGFTFQNVHRAIKRGHKHKGFNWNYQS